MAATGPNGNNIDIEIGRRRRQKPSIACSSGTTTDGSVCFSDSGDDQTWRSGGSYEECRSSEIDGVSISCPQSRGESSMSECLSETDLESGELEMEVHYYSRKKKRKKKQEKEERECRICHLNLVCHEEESERGVAIELGCDCKGDLGAAHKQCAETWFKIRGNITCEICGAIALNVAGEQTNEANDTDGVVAESTIATELHSET